MRPLTDFEKLNLKPFVDKGMEFALIEPTATGLRKSIMDATSTVRRLLKRNQIHDYKSQSQGPNNKIQEQIYFIGEKLKTLSKASFYRPNTKNGDPRIWLKYLPKFALDSYLGRIFWFVFWKN